MLFDLSVIAFPHATAVRIFAFKQFQQSPIRRLLQLQFLSGSFMEPHWMGQNTTTIAAEQGLFCSLGHQAATP